MGITILKGSIYEDAGATATDNIDGDLTSSIVVGGLPDTNTVGNYTITYNVTDAAGNAATPVTRTVSVVTEIPVPVITLTGTLNGITDYSDGSLIRFEFTDTPALSGFKSTTEDWPSLPISGTYSSIWLAGSSDWNFEEINFNVDQNENPILN